MKKYLILALALLLCAVSLLSCNKESGTPDSTTATPEITTEGSSVEQTPSELTLKIEDDRLNFKVVRSDALSDGNPVIDIAMDIRTRLAELFGTNVAIGNDFVKAGSSHDDSTLEILVGVTKYPQSQKWEKECNYGEYIIKAEGNKIVIMAFSEHCLRTAASSFILSVKSAFDQSTKSATLTSDSLSEEKEYDSCLASIPVFDGGSFKTYYDAGNRTNAATTQCDQIIIEKTNAEHFSAYLDKLSVSGFTKNAENTMNNSRFATFTNSEYMVNVGYYAHDMSCRILVEPITPAKNGNPLVDAPHTKITSSQITLIGLEYPDASHSCGYITNGICLLIRLEDGRFIIVDGGFNRALHGNNLVNAIKEQSKNYTSKPVVAAWIMTHAHGDHHGTLVGYQSLFFNSGIVVENLLANFMSESERKKAANTYNSSFGTTEGTGAASILQAGEALGADIYKVHVGQVYHYANLELEIIYTLESFAPSVPNGLNTASLVTRMTFSDFDSDKKTTFLCTGDATGWAMDISNKMFGTYLQSDILQICHHGAGTAGNDNGTANAYKTVNASLVLWPLGLHEYHVYVNKPYNKVVFDQTNYVECYFAGSQGDMTIVPLPYVAGETKITVKCIGDCPVSHDHNENTKK